MKDQRVLGRARHGTSYKAYCREAMRRFCEAVESAVESETGTKPSYEKLSAELRGSHSHSTWASWKSGSRPNDFDGIYLKALERGWVKAGGLVAQRATGAGKKRSMRWLRLGSHYVQSAQSYEAQKARDIGIGEVLYDEELGVIYPSVSYDPLSLESAERLRAIAAEIERRAREAKISDDLHAE